MVSSHFLVLMNLKNCLIFLNKNCNLFARYYQNKERLQKSLTIGFKIFLKKKNGNMFVKDIKTFLNMKSKAFS